MSSRVFAKSGCGVLGGVYTNNVVGCHVIPVACAQILEVKLSNQPIRWMVNFVTGIVL